ncbi:MAG: hypothetical protein NTX88_05635 [Candidatus Atribacteria bacterium]|nr:hypothetical protein [Candidatus Atribacteria bacterium]
MSLEDILKKIEQEAQAREKSILESARLEAEKKLDKARKKIEQEAEVLRQRRISEAQVSVQRELAEAKLSGRSMIGKVKSASLQSLRKELFDAFTKKVDTQKSWYSKVILAYSTTRNEEIIMAPHEAGKLGEQFIVTLNREAKTSFKFGGVTTEIERGFLMKKGGMILNLSFSSLLEDVLRQNESQVSKMFFPGSVK